MFSKMKKLKYQALLMTNRSGPDLANNFHGRNLDFVEEIHWRKTKSLYRIKRRNYLYHYDYLEMLNTKWGKIRTN